MRRPTDGPPRCTVYLAERRDTCGARDGVRYYLPGYACPEHTPARMRALYARRQQDKTQGAT